MKKTKLTQVQIARALGVSTRSIRRYISDAKPPKWYVLAMAELARIVDGRK